MSERSILIVDDEKNIRLALSQALASLGFALEEAPDGEEALRKLEGRSYSLLLLDLKLPGMDGMEVLRRTRDLRPELRVVILTAYGSVESAVEAMKLGAVDFVQKPFTPGEIRQLVLRILDRESLDEGQVMDYGSRIELAKRCVGRREFEAAADHVQRAIALDTSQPEAFNLLGALREIAGDRHGAQKDYRIALALDPSYKPAVANLMRATGASEGEIVLEAPSKTRRS